MSNKDDLQAIGDYVMNRSRPAPGAPASVFSKWNSYRTQWMKWYPGVTSSWYVSDADVARGRSIRNALMQNQDPDTWQYVQETAADKPGRKPHDQRPDAPVAGKKPWERKGLTYSGKYKTRAAVEDLQRRINAAGYQPPLKVDGKYGKGTQAGEAWLSLQSAAKQAAQQIAAETKPATPPKPATPKPQAEPAAAPPKKNGKEKVAGLSILGIPVNVRTVAGAVAGAVGGFMVAPVAALVGAPIGFAAVGKLFPSKEA